MNSTKFEMKKGMIEHLIRSIFLFLLAGAFLLISVGMKCSGATQNVLIGLGTGSATSFLVSFVFYLTDKLIKKNNCLINKDAFISDFKILFSRLIESIVFVKPKDGEYDFQTFIKIQHRWFHDYYKRMTINNDNPSETKERLDAIRKYVDDEEHFYERTFGINDKWRQAGFSTSQVLQLENLYYLYKSVIISLKNSRDSRAIFDFAFLLEEYNRIPESFEDASSFKLIKFNIENNNVTIVLDAFEEKEPLLKFAREFNEIRHKNYLKEYGQVSNNNHNEQ